MALAAESRQVVWLFAGRAVVYLGLGLAIGLAGAVGVGRLLESLLVGTSSTDPPTLLLITLVIVVVGAAARLWPARRAARLITVGVSQLEPAAPRVDRDTVYLDITQRGPMVRQVRGTGTLVPEAIRWIPATTEGTVERIVIRPGAEVTPDTVVLELSNPELEQTALEGRAPSSRQPRPGSPAARPRSTASC